jgi:MarR family 2-MHQ and catechol resistance regulon transcriptional repressor
MNDFQISDPVINAYVLLLNTSDIVSRRAEMGLSKLGITSTQYTVLVTLKFCPKPPTLTELSQRLFRTKNSLTTVIDNMERDGLVKRIRDVADRRAIRVVATEKGAELFERVRAPSRELVYQIMSCYDEEDVSRLSELLQRVRRHTLQELACGNSNNLVASQSKSEAQSQSR